MPSSRKKSSSPSSEPPFTTKAFEEVGIVNGGGKNGEQGRIAESSNDNGIDPDASETVKPETPSRNSEENSEGATVVLNVTSHYLAEPLEKSDNADCDKNDENDKKDTSNVNSALKDKFQQIDNLLNRSTSSNEEKKPETPDSSNPTDANGENRKETPGRNGPKRRRFTCYNCFIFIMDATLLILSLLYPILMKTKSKVTFAEQYSAGDAGSVASVASPPSRGITYAHVSPRGFFEHGSPWQNLLVEDIFDGDLTTLKSHVGAAEWTLVLYYAPWDKDSVSARKAFAYAAVAAANYGGASSPILAATVRFAAINCWWRHGSCRSKVTKMRPFPYVYAYNGNWKGFLYQGAHDQKGYLDFLNRLIHPYEHLASADQLSTLLATRDTVILAHLDASNAVFNVTPGVKPNDSTPLQTFYDAALHFTQAPHHLSFQFLLVTSPSLALVAEVPIVNTMRVFKSLEPSSLFNVTTSTANGLIAMLDRNAASATVSLVSEIPSSQQLVTRLTSTNISVLLFGADVRSSSAFHPAYQEFRETALWFRACGSYYHKAFRYILASSDERFNAQHFCCDYQDLNEDFYFEKSSSYFGPHLPDIMENQICNAKSSVSTVAKNVTSRDCAGKREKRASSQFSSPLPSASSDSAFNRHWSRRCQQFILNPSLCHHRLTKTAAGVVQDSILSVPAFAGLSCRTNRTIGFRYIVRQNFPTLTRRFGITENDLDTSVVILDNEAEESFVVRKVENSRDLGDFIVNFTRKLLMPFRRSGASDAAADAETFSHERCLKRKTVPFTANVSLRNSSSPLNISPSQTSSDVASLNSCLLELSSNSLRSLLSEGRELALLFYTKTCGLCKTFNRYFLRLSKLFRDCAPGFRLARIDVDQNDLPINLTVGAVPAIIFFRGINFSRAFRPADVRNAEKENGQPVNSHSYSFPRLSLSDLILFIVRHVKDSGVREKFASKLCDSTCLNNNLEDVRESSAQLRRKKDEVVHAMLAINERVRDAEKEMMYHVDRCAGHPTNEEEEGQRIARSGKEGDGVEGEEDEDETSFEECRMALEALKKRVEGFARRLQIKGDQLSSIEKRAKALTQIEAKIAWTLYKKK